MGFEAFHRHILESMVALEFNWDCLASFIFRCHLSGRGIFRQAKLFEDDSSDTSRRTCSL